MKSIESVTGDLPLFDEQMLRLARWIADYYAAPFESAIAAILPAAVRRGRAPSSRSNSLQPACAGVDPTPEEEAVLAKRSPRQAGGLDAAEGAEAK